MRFFALGSRQVITVNGFLVYLVSCHRKYFLLQQPTTATGLLSGTSQASPHVAGIYAAVKAANPLGVSVADVAAWVVSTGSIPVTINLPAPTGNQVFRRVRVP